MHDGGRRQPACAREGTGEVTLQVQGVKLHRLYTAERRIHWRDQR